MLLTLSSYMSRNFTALGLLQRNRHFCPFMIFRNLTLTANILLSETLSKFSYIGTPLKERRGAYSNCGWTDRRQLETDIRRRSCTDTVGYSPCLCPVYLHWLSSSDGRTDDPRVSYFCCWRNKLQATMPIRSHLVSWPDTTDSLCLPACQPHLWVQVRLSTESVYNSS